MTPEVLATLAAITVVALTIGAWRWRQTAYARWRYELRQQARADREVAALEEGWRLPAVEPERRGG